MCRTVSKQRTMVNKGRGANITVFDPSNNTFYRFGKILLFSQRSRESQKCLSPLQSLRGGTETSIFLLWGRKNMTGSRTTVKSVGGFS